MTESPYLTMQEAGEYLRFKPKYARISAQRFCKENGIPLSRRGRTLLVRKAFLDQFVDHGDNSGPRLALPQRRRA